MIQTNQQERNTRNALTEHLPPPPQNTPTERAASALNCLDQLAKSLEEIQAKALFPAGVDIPPSPPDPMSIDRMLELIYDRSSALMGYAATISNRL